MSYRRKIKGLTLLECLISTALGLLLIAAVFSFFSASMKNMQTITEATRSQNDALSLLILLKTDISRAGAFGCSREAANSKGLQGLMGSGQRVAVSYRAIPSVSVLAMTQDHRQLVVSRGVSFEKNQTVLVTQPDALDKVKLESVSQALSVLNLSLATPVSLSSTQQASVAKFIHHDYYYEASHQRLMRSSASGSPQVVSDHLESFSLTYDIETPKGIQEGIPTTKQAMDAVRGIHIALSLHGVSLVGYAPILSRLS